MNERTAIVAMLDGANFTHLRSARLLLSLGNYYLQRQLDAPRAHLALINASLARAINQVIQAIEAIDEVGK